MAKSETQIGKLVINLQAKTKDLENGLNIAKKKLEEMEKQNKEVENSNKGLDASYLALSATAVVALNKIGSAIKQAVEEYKAYTQAMSSLQNVSEYTGQSMSDFSNIMEKFGSYMTQADLATTIKNFSLMGFTAQQTEQMIEALTNSAIRNRNANYTVSEAVRVASEGYRQGLSTLSDSAGVTENLSVMLDNYAKSIGKTASQLTEAEKNQAYLTRTMQAAEPFASAMNDYLDSLAGKQGQYSQAMRETQVAYAEALEPTLISMTEMGTQLLNFLNIAIEKQPELAAGTTAFATTLATVTVALIALATAKSAYSKVTGVATASTKAFTQALLSNPLTWWSVGISAVIGLITTFYTKINNIKNQLQEYVDELNKTSEAQERLNKIMNKSLEYTDENIQKVKEDKKAAEERLKLIEETIEKEKELLKLRGQKIPDTSDNTSKRNKETVELIRNNSRLSGSYKMTSKAITEYNKYLYENFENEKKTCRQQLIDIAQTKTDIQGKQELLNIIKKGETATQEYTDAKSKLVKVYPELAKANENTIASTQRQIDAENAAADAEWVNAQIAIQASILEVTAMQSNKKQIEDLANATKRSVEEVTASLQNQIDVLANLAKLSPSDFKGSVTTSYTPRTTTSSRTSSSGSSSSTYENKALDNYKKQLEYKKSLDRLSLKEEISGYEYALRRYAKTQDEKQELTTKLYELKKELQQKELDDYTDYIEYKKALDKIDLQDEINMYQYAYNELAKTTEQKRDLEVKIYELKKELKDKEEQDQQNLLDKHIEYIQYKKSLDQLSAQEEIDAYQYAYDNLAKTTEQKRDLEVTLYDLRKQLQQDIEEAEREWQDNKLNTYITFIEHKKAMDKVSAENEIKAYEYVYNNLAKTTEDKMQLEEKIYELRKKLQEDRLNSYIEDVNYKKSLDQLSLSDEIKAYEYALKNLAKTTEQKKDIEKTLYNLRKQLQEETAEALKAEADAEKELLDERTKSYEEFIEKQKQQRGASYDVKEQLEDYNKLIQMHKQYLSQILKDERYSLEERKTIYQEELEIVKNYEQQKRNLRVSSIDNTVNQLKNAITKQLEEMRDIDKEAIEENIKLVEEWKEARVNAINEEYNARIEAIQKELDLLDKSEQEKTRAEEDAEYERKRNRLQELIDYEHDAVTKANYEKELAKLKEEYQKTLDNRKLADRKEELKTEQELLKDEQNNKVKEVEEEAEKQKELYNNQLDNLEEYYNKQIEMAEETAQKMLLNVDANQKQILNLLKKYGNEYEITGQTLGEKLAQGIQNGIADKIEGIIQKIQDSIDNAINNKIASWTKGLYEYNATAGKPQTISRSISIQQYNTIQQNPEMPSETYRKLNDVSQKLAGEIAGM